MYQASNVNLSQPTYNNTSYVTNNATQKLHLDTDTVVNHQPQIQLIQNEDRQQVQHQPDQDQTNYGCLDTRDLCGYSLTAVIDNSLPFSFEDIGAIINSSDFGDHRPTEISPNVQAVDAIHQGQQQVNNVVGPASKQYQQVLQASQQSAQSQFMKDTIAVTKFSDQNNQKEVLIKNTNYYDDQDMMTNAENMLAQHQNHPQQQNQLAYNKQNNLYNNPFPSPPRFDDKCKPYVEIVEQPAKCSLRFRYKCEGRSAGSLPGVNSTLDNKTFPSIKITNYVGRAVVVVSCVTRDAPYRAHPHNIVGKEGCKKGICTIKVNVSEPGTIKTFSSLGIQCVKRKDIEESLSLRESINVDPFRNGFSHKLSASSIDLNVVRLCFQVFVEGSTPNKYDVPLTPIVSDPIHDKKAMSDLVITKLSHCSAPATGGREVILLCDRIAKDDTQIRFYEERDGKLVWETFTELSPTDVHKQVAICFKTPKYHDENITQPVMARIQLKRVSDNQVSEPRLFQFLPCESDEDIISRKRQKIEWVNMNHYALDNILQSQSQSQSQSQHHQHGLVGNQVHHQQHVSQQQQALQDRDLQRPQAMDGVAQPSNPHHLEDF